MSLHQSYLPSQTITAVAKTKTWILGDGLWPQTRAGNSREDKSTDKQSVKSLILAGTVALKPSAVSSETGLSYEVANDMFILERHLVFTTSPTGSIAPAHSPQSVDKQVKMPSNLNLLGLTNQLKTARNGREKPKATHLLDKRVLSLPSCPHSLGGRSSEHSKSQNSHGYVRIK